MISLKIYLYMYLSLKCQTMEKKNIMISQLMSLKCLLCLTNNPEKLNLENLWHFCLKNGINSLHVN